MRCPDDGSPLVADQPGIHACRRCRGHAVQRSAFEASHRDVENLLEPEADRRSGAFAHERACPECARTMAPLRLGIQLCWIDWCSSCGVLWIETLDTFVINRLEQRIALERGALAFPPDERRTMAAEIAHDSGQLERTRRRLQLMTDLIRWFRWWWV